ncbi:hypothetical protein C8R47DRAFT_1087554 [Mycena vitilis]|nr:hypothetical protein C8R47DRAFT_1132405 [Mycena vitilis]KAJ6517527.1 hypothetical protein C8R47DRAFT_1087554 [Mycena vitilis]
MDSLYRSSSPINSWVSSQYASTFGFPPPWVLDALGPHGGYKLRLISLSSMMSARSFWLIVGSFFQLQTRTALEDGSPSSALSLLLSSSSMSFFFCFFARAIPFSVWALTRAGGLEGGGGGALALPAALGLIVALRVM